MNIARTTLSSKLLTHHKDHFASLAVQAILRLKGSGNLEAIKIIKKLGGGMKDSYLEEGQCPPPPQTVTGPSEVQISPFPSTILGFLLEKKVGVNQPKRLENARILIANTAMDTDKIKVFGSKVRVDSTAKVAELELAEKVGVVQEEPTKGRVWRWAKRRWVWYGWSYRGGPPRKIFLRV